jgi:hypothetical protein
MENSAGLKIVEEKLVESLSFASISQVEIENLFKAAVSMDCESMEIVWRSTRGYDYVRLTTGIVWDEYSHKKSKVLTIDARSGRTEVRPNSEFSEGKFYSFHFELAEQKKMKYPKRC